MYHGISVGRGIGQNFYLPLSNVSIPEGYIGKKIWKNWRKAQHLQGVELKTRWPPLVHCALTGKKCSLGSIFYGTSISGLGLTDGCRGAVGQHESGIKASVLDQESWQVTERWKFQIAFQNNFSFPTANTGIVKSL